MATFVHGDVELYYEVQGRGEPLLLIAGLAADSAFWLPVQEIFAATRQVIVLDNRGCGRTTPLDAGSSMRTMADDTMALVRHLNLTKVDVVGHSMGGMIAMECAVWRCGIRWRPLRRSMQRPRYRRSARARWC